MALTLKALAAIPVLLPLALASEVPNVDTIVANMERAHQQNRAQYRPYVVTRSYALYDAEQPKPKSQVIAQVSFLPPAHKEFEIKRTVGSGHGEKVARRVLQHEAELARDGSVNEISRRNYEFTLVGQETVDGARCFVLELRPMRKEKDLIEGYAWVDASSFLLRRVEGRLAKNPSFWVRNVRLKLTYGQVNGMWLQTGADSTADVRILGPHRFVGRDLSYRTGEVVARQLRRPARARPPRPSPATAAGVGILEAR